MQCGDSNQYNKYRANHIMNVFWAKNLLKNAYVAMITAKVDIHELSILLCQYFSNFQASVFYLKKRIFVLFELRFCLYGQNKVEICFWTVVPKTSFLANQVYDFLLDKNISADRITRII